MFSAHTAKALLITLTGVVAACQAVSDQQRIVFDSDRDGNPEIYAMYPDGSNPQRLTDSKGSDEFPAWSPDRKQIAFASDREGHLEIYVMNQDGSNPQRLTHTAGGQSVNPAWSPDGKKIAFESSREGHWEIYVINADGSNIRRLTHTEGDKSSENPDWSPNGEWIAFDSNRDKKQDIYVMDPDGSNLRRLTYTPGDGPGSEHPTWSPNGKRIAFDSSWGRNLTNWENGVEIYVMDADGSNTRRLSTISGTAGSSLCPVWSPDGEKITFISTRDGASKNWSENMEIYAMDANGSNVRRLTFNKAWDAHGVW